MKMKILPFSMPTTSIIVDNHLKKKKNPVVIFVNVSLGIT